MERSRGVVIVVVGLLVFSATMAVSAATAPSRNVNPGGPSAPTNAAESTPTPAEIEDTTTNGTTTDRTTTASREPNRALVGVQGGGPEWREHGQVGLLVDGEMVWSVSDADSYFDVTRMADGRVVTGFMHGGYEEECGPYESPCTKTGIRIVDPTGDGEPTVETIYTLPVRSPVNSEIHDVEPLGDDRFLFTDMENERIAIVRNDEITWEWSASSFYDAPDDPTRNDWLHINDVDVIGEDRYLVSVRNANQVLVIQRGEGVVEVINEDREAASEPCTEHRGIADFDDDGEVRCGDPDVIDEQHNPQWLGDGAVLIADSENDRIVELHRTDSGVWEPVWELTEAGGLGFSWPRDADRLPNGNTLITDSLHKRVVEVEPSGDVVWSYGWDTLIPYEADPSPAGEYPGAIETATTETATSGTATATNERTTIGGATKTATRTPESLGTIAAAQSADLQTTDSSIPGLSLLLVGMRAVAPWLPFWFSELQLGITLVAVGLAFGGGIDIYRRD